MVYEKSKHAYADIRVAIRATEVKRDGRDLSNEDQAALTAAQDRLSRIRGTEAIEFVAAMLLDGVPLR